MNRITQKQFLNAPPLIQYVYTMAVLGVPIGIRIYEDAKEKHPEYFKEEKKREDKLSKIPQHVHDEYKRERDKIRESSYRNLPPSKGILWWANDYNGYKEWQKIYSECREIEKALSKVLFEKMYSRYKIKWEEFGEYLW